MRTPTHRKRTRVTDGKLDAKMRNKNGRQGGKSREAFQSESERERERGREVNRGTSMRK